MLAIACSFLSLVISGNIFRGGIEIGLAGKIESNDIYGPALLEAYELETKVAHYPRIVIGDELVNLLETTMRSTEDNVQSKINRELSQECYNMLMEDADGRYALDYLGQKCREMLIEKFPDVYEKAKSFLEKRLLEIKKEKSTELFPRYLWLTDYFNLRLPSWQVSDELD